MAVAAPFNAEDAENAENAEGRRGINRWAVMGPLRLGSFLMRYRGLPRLTPFWRFTETVERGIGECDLG
jgi:hypothetical protein